jgi:hypothetical protein
MGGIVLSIWGKIILDAISSQASPLILLMWASGTLAKKRGRSETLRPVGNFIR